MIMFVILLVAFKDVNVVHQVDLNSIRPVDGSRGRRHVGASSCGGVCVFPNPFVVEGGFFIFLEGGRKFLLGLK